MARAVSDSPEIIRGTRRYDVTRSVQDGKLYLVGGAGVVWQSIEFTAQCLMGGNARQHLLKGNCGCGVNIAKSGDPHNGWGPIVAEIIGWGAFVEGTLGWRTEFGEIIALIIEDKWQDLTKERLASELFQTYNVPVAIR